MLGFLFLLYDTYRYLLCSHHREAIGEHRLVVVHSKRATVSLACVLPQHSIATHLHLHVLVTYAVMQFI